jgi:hypothetical protein
MNSQELRNLQEAYIGVYGLDEKTATPPSRYDVRKGLDTKSRRLRRSSDFYTYGGENQDPDERTISTSKGEGGITKNPKKLRKQKAMGEFREQVDLYDIILSHLLDEGYAETQEQAEVIMVNMSEGWRESIVEGGFNSSGRYDVGGGRTVGPVAGAVRSLFSGNLPKGQTYVPPSPQRGTNRPPAVPSSKDDSGKLTDFGAGGGKAKLKTGMSVGQVERQGRMNKGDYSG